VWIASTIAFKETLKIVRSFISLILLSESESGWRSAGFQGLFLLTPDHFVKGIAAYKRFAWH
jgi:hypothetical protein